MSDGMHTKRKGAGIGTTDSSVTCLCGCAWKGHALWHTVCCESLQMNMVIAAEEWWLPLEHGNSSHDTLAVTPHTTGQLESGSWCQQRMCFSRCCHGEHAVMAHLHEAWGQSTAANFLGSSFVGRTSCPALCSYRLHCAAFTQCNHSLAQKIWHAERLGGSSEVGGVRMTYAIVREEPPQNRKSFSSERGHDTEWTVGCACNSTLHVSATAASLHVWGIH